MVCYILTQIYDILLDVTFSITYCIGPDVVIAKARSVMDEIRKCGEIPQISGNLLAQIKKPHYNSARKLRHKYWRFFDGAFEIPPKIAAYIGSYVGVAKW